MQRRKEPIRRINTDLSVEIGDLLDKLVDEGVYLTRRSVIEHGIELVAKEAGVEMEVTNG